MKKKLQNIIISVPIDKEMDTELKEITQDGLMNRSEFVRRAIKDRIKRQKQKEKVV